MDLDLIFLDKTSLNKKLRDVLALITLKLNYLPQFFVLHNVTITAELLLHVFENLLVAELFFQTLNCCQALLSVPLLDANMNILLRSGGIRIFGVGKWIKCRWDLEI